MHTLLFSITLLMLGAAQGVWAQTTPQPLTHQTPLKPTAPQRTPTTPEDMAYRETRRMQLGLYLDSVQYNKVYAINLDIEKQRQALRAAGGHYNKQQEEQLEETRFNRIIPVLNPSQKEQYQKMWDQLKALSKPNTPPKGGSNKPGEDAH